MASFPYVPTSNVFNTADYTILTDELTREVADKLYLSISDGRYITGITEGVASPSKALVLNSSLNISGINDVSSSYLETKNSNGSLITSSSIGSDYGLHLHSVLTSSNGTYAGSSISFNNSSTDTVPLGAICLNKVSAGNGDLIFSTRNSATCDERMRILSTGNVAIGTTTASHRLNVSGDIDCSGSYRVGGVALDLSLLTGITAGTATASKALVVDSSRNITNIGRINITSSDATATIGTTPTSSFALNILGTVNSNGIYNSCGIAFRNAASDGIANGAVSIQRTGVSSADLLFLTQSPSNNLSESLRVLSTGAIAINSPAVAAISCIGSSNYVDGSFQRLLNLRSTNASSVEFEIQVNSGANTTSTNSAFIGTMTNNDLRFGTNNSTRMILRNSGWVGIGVTNPSEVLDVNGSVYINDALIVGGNRSFALTSVKNYDIASNLYQSLSNGNYNLSASFAGPIKANSIFSSSDRRLKKDIEDFDISFEKYFQLAPKRYKWKNSNQSAIGLISQELMDIDELSMEMLNISENKELSIEGHNDIEGAQYSINYSQLSVVNITIIKKLIKQIESLKTEIDMIRKFLDKV